MLPIGFRPHMNSKMVSSPVRKKDVERSKKALANLAESIPPSSDVSDPPPRINLFYDREESNATFTRNDKNEAKHIMGAVLNALRTEPVKPAPAKSIEINGDEWLLS